MDATCTIQDSIHVFNLVHKYVSRILGTYQEAVGCFCIFREVALLPVFQCLFHRNLPDLLILQET
jgi:hypothetical protein